MLDATADKEALEWLADGSQIWRRTSFYWFDKGEAESAGDDAASILRALSPADCSAAERLPAESGPEETSWSGCSVS